MNRGVWGLVAASVVWLGCNRSPEPRFGEPAEPRVKEPASEPAEAKAQPTRAAGAAKESAPEGEAKSEEQKAPATPQAPVRTPTSPDPLKGEFGLKDAVEGLEGDGALKASIETSLGTLSCTLFDDKAPNTVANFVGLARGKRPFWDANQAEWVKRPLYDGTTFHRVIPGFMIQGGDYMGTGAGDIGYTIDDELHPSLKHDKAGLLCMANKGPDTNGAQFFITDAPAPHLTAMKSYTIFGECGPTELISKIANAPKDPRRRERPQPDVEIRSIDITRGK